MRGVRSRAIETDGITVVSPESTRVLCQREIPDELSLRMWPGRDEAIARHSEIVALRDRVDKTIREGSGLAVLRFAGLEERPRQAIAAGWNFFTVLGKPIPQYSSGELAFHVRDEGNAPTRNHYSATNRGGSYHTDGTFLPQTPFYVGLICARQATYGGESILIDIRKLYDALADRHPDVIDALQRSYHFDCCGQFPGLETRYQPILSHQDGQLFVQYLRGYIETGQEKANAPLDAPTRACLDMFDELARQETFQWNYKLQPGEMLVFNNTLMLHGRTAFADDRDNRTRSQRWLVRVYAEPHS